MPLRATQKLFLSYLAIIAAVVLALTFGVRTTLRQQLLRSTTDDVRRELDVARAYVAARRDLPPDPLAHRLGALVRRRVTLIARDGRVLGDSEVPEARLGAMENHGGRPEVRAALRGGVGVDVRRSRTLGIGELYIAGPVAGGSVLRIAFPLAHNEAALRSAQLGVLGVGLMAALLTALLSLGFSVAVTRPLRGMAASARAMARGELDRRVRHPHGDELGELGDALDTLAAQLRRRIAQLEGERAEMQTLIDAMAEGVIAFAPDGRVRRANPAARRFFSLPPDPRDLAPEAVARRPAFLDLVRRARAGELVPATDFTDGDRALLTTAQPLPDGGAVVVLLDVTESRRLDDVRRDFVANASHELKTPLTAIRGYSETLLDPDLPPELRQQFTRTVKDNAERLQRIIDDLLDLSRIESGGWRVEPEVVSLADAVGEAWAPCARAAEAKKVRLETDFGVDAELVFADSAALGQIFANLFGNAMRHLEEGGRVRVETRTVTPPDPRPNEQGGWVRVAVVDNGCGIPAVHLPRIFERFYRADTARSRAQGGTGLGLAIVRHLVERHGGSIRADSELGVGTTISFTLPTARRDP